jgi:radical SAM superfamily enzyme YgiQ (UPF0313 family)
MAGLIRKTTNLFGNTRAELHVSVNPFVPKRTTALEDQPLYPLSYYENAQSRLAQMFRGIEGMGYRFESLKTLHLHYYLSVGNEQIGNLLGSCISRGTFRGFREAAKSILEQR